MQVKEVNVLVILLNKDRTSQLKSVGIIGLLKMLENANKKMSESTLRRCMINLMKSDYVRHGVKNEQEKKYYITETGINLIGEITGGVINE